MVKISEAIDECRKILKGSVEDAGFEAYVLAQAVLGMDKLALRMHSEDGISDELYDKLISCAGRREAGEPSAYITGLREFMSLDFEVNKNVLIPRPDTEILVETVIEKYKSSDVRILDICTGSGAIACSLAYYIPGAYVLGIDISSGALSVAEANSKRTHTQSRVVFKKADALALTPELGKFDAVVSNPPYIETDTISGLDRSVKEFEPIIALDGGNDGLVFYRAIVEAIDKILKKDGWLYFEIGYNQAEAVCEIIGKRFCNIRVIKDLGGNDRVVCGQLV